MQLTNQQFEALKEKCPECRGKMDAYVGCNSCLSTGQATIEIDKEWVEIKCNNCEGSTCIRCGGDGIKSKIQKYQVGDIIEELDSILNEEEHEKSMVRIIKLKILSETEDKWKVYLG